MVNVLNNEYGSSYIFVDSWTVLLFIFIIDWLMAGENLHHVVWQHAPNDQCVFKKYTFTNTVDNIQTLFVRKTFNYSTVCANTVIHIQ